MAQPLPEAPHAAALSPDRGNRRRSARLPQGRAALCGRAASGHRRRRPQPAELPDASAAHPRVRRLMHILYEEEGALKVGAVLAQAPASMQVESPHGRRSKVKAASVLLSFERPSGAELLAAAEKFAADLDVSFLWECSAGR